MPPHDRDEFYRLICREGPWLITRAMTESGEAEFIDYRDESGHHVWPVFSTQTTVAMWVRESGVKERATRAISRPSVERVVK